MCVEWNKIRAFAFDVDGVLTDGGIYAVDGGDLYRRFDSKDALALRMADLKGYRLAIITGGRSDSIRQRFLCCGFTEEDIYMHCIDKRAAFEDFCRKYGLDTSEAVYCGDDLPDIPALKAAGAGVCPADAVEEVKEAADYVSELPGGKRFVRDLIEKVMRSRGDWSLDIACYQTKF